MFASPSIKILQESKFSLILLDLKQVVHCFPHIYTIQNTFYLYIQVVSRVIVFDSLATESPRCSVSNFTVIPRSSLTFKHQHPGVVPVWWDSFHHNVEGKIRTKRKFFLQRTSFAVHMQPPWGGSAESSPYGYQNTNRQCFSTISGHAWGFFFFKLWIDLYKCKDFMRYNHFICLKQSFKERRTILRSGFSEAYNFPSQSHVYWACCIVCFSLLSVCLHWCVTLLNVIKARTVFSGDP